MKRVISGKIKGILKTKSCLNCGKDIDLYGIVLCAECKKGIEKSGNQR